MAELRDLIVYGNSRLIGDTDASKIVAVSVSGSSISASVVSASVAVTASSILTTNFTASKISASGAITASTIRVTDATATNVYVSRISASGPVTASSAVISNVTASKISSSGAITASAFFKAGGTAAQFLKANGSVDSNVYATTGSVSASIAAAEKVFVINPSSTTWGEVREANLAGKVVFYKGAVLEYINCLVDEDEVRLEEAAFSRVINEGCCIRTYHSSDKALSAVVGDLSVWDEEVVFANTVEDYVQLSVAANSSIDALFGITS